VADDDAIALCKQLGITYEAYSSHGPYHQPKPVLSDPTVKKVAKAHIKSAAEVDMAWILQQGHAIVTAVQVRCAH